MCTVAVVVSEEDLLRGMSEAQARAVTEEAAPLCVLAGAGSGKTRVLTRRLAWRAVRGTANPRHALALTFTRKAGAELRDRLAQLGVRDQVAAGTFHSVALAQLRRRWSDSGASPPQILERKASLLAPMTAELRRAGRGGASERHGVSGSGRGPEALRVPEIADLASEIEWAKARMIAPDAYADQADRAGRAPPIPLWRMAEVYDRYEREKRKRGVVDFDDLLLLCASAIEDDPRFAASQRWRFRHLFVD